MDLSVSFFFFYYCYFEFVVLNHITSYRMLLLIQAQVLFFFHQRATSGVLMAEPQPKASVADGLLNTPFLA